MAQTEAEMDDQARQSSEDDDKLEITGMNATEPPTKKRRRTAKPNSGKKFECRHEGCGKSYSRAEHLYRHQLNHTPKSIYRCDYPDCNRYFVRQDLCIRHRDRHTTHGSQLHKRDTFAQSNTGQVSATAEQSNDSGGSHQSPAQTDALMTSPSSPQDQRSEIKNGSGGSVSTAVSDHRFQPPTPHNVPSRPGTSLLRSVSGNSNPPSPAHKQVPQSWNIHSRKESSSSRDTQAHAQYGNLSGLGQGGIPLQSNAAPSPGRSFSISSTSTHVRLPRQNSSGPHVQNMSVNGFAIPTNSQPMEFASSEISSPGVARSSHMAFAAAVSYGLNGIRTDPHASYPTVDDDLSAIDLSAAYGYPVFGGDSYNQTPFPTTDDFTAWLFNENQNVAVAYNPNAFMSGYNDGPAPQVQGPFMTDSPVSSLNFGISLPMQHSMGVTSGLDHSANSQYIMSGDKRQELLDLMLTQFIERSHDAVKKRKDSVFEGDIDSDGHILSLRMMHTYIGSYWYHQHAQLPILHKPTFSADRTPNLLLLAVIAIGAATMDKAYGTSLTDSAAEFANFVAWHVRWEIVRDADFRPPAKLWIFQTLILIEVYEKMYATRALHERAHIHHDTTLTLMRRGSSLLGRSVSDSPPSHRDERTGKSSGSTSASEASRSEESWTRWIGTEATRRAAFAAFVLDSTHATMFGHSAKMVAHEMRLPLPCDEGLWSAISPAEAGRVQSSLQTNGIKPTMFLDGLKKTLNGQRVRTNSFGRTIIMAGLLSVSWHMSQRDLQINSLGPRTVQTFGGPDKWKGVLLRAFDNWKRDFDEALAEATPSLRQHHGHRQLDNSSPDPDSMQGTSSPSLSRQDSNSLSTAMLLRPVDDENIFESRTVLHHLAHIAAHVDVVDCQVFAGANRLLGRSITPKDYSVIREKITDRWATKASARDAAWYALKFLSMVLLPHDGTEGSDHDKNGNSYSSSGGHANTRFYGHASPILPQAFDGKDMYMARDDFLLNRPWVLYISALVVWSYGFALEGPLNPTPPEEQFDSYENQHQDMVAYLRRVGGVRAPDDLVGVKGKNRCVGLLMVLRRSFEATRWELTREAGGLLGNCVGKLLGSGEVDGDRMAGG